ncbi:MAG: TetR/AcrR family transcriptional regulator [Acidimicrobiales bacterium]
MSRARHGVGGGGPDGSAMGGGQTDRTDPGAAFRPMRADAVKNRQRILEAAADVFAEKGLSVPIDEIAERAGVGVGTLYRHFPTKEALFEAIVTTTILDLVDTVRSACGCPDAGPALFDFIRQLASEAAIKQDLLDALDSAGIDVKSGCAESMEELQAGIGRLLVRAAAAGEVRDDVRADDLLGLVIGTCHGMRRLGRNAEDSQRLIGILCEGLRPARP